MVYTVSSTETAAFTLGQGGGVENTLQDIATVLATPKGSVPFYRDFGIEMDFLDLPTPAAKQMMRSRVREAVERWVPNTVVRSIDFKADPSNPGKQISIVEVEISAEES